MNITGRIESSVGVLNNPTNDSSAKYQWSFSKSARFPEKKGYTNTISYDIPTTKSKRKSGFGYGGRSKHFDGQNKDNPPPTSYRLNSSFDPKRAERAHSFTLHRDNITFANYLNQS